MFSLSLLILENCSFCFFPLHFEDRETLRAGGGAILFSVSVFGVFWLFSWYLGVALLYSFSLLQYSVSESLNWSILLCLCLFFPCILKGTKSVKNSLIYGTTVAIVIVQLNSSIRRERRLSKVRGLVLSLEKLFVQFKTPDPAFRDLYTASFSNPYRREKIAGEQHEQRQTISNFPPQTTPQTRQRPSRPSCRGSVDSARGLWKTQRNKNINWKPSSGRRQENEMF